MKSKIVLIILIGFIIKSHSQHFFRNDEEPVFETKSDSISYVQMNETIQRAIKEAPQSKSNIDSLFFLSSQLRKKAIGVRKSYRATPAFISMDSLVKITDLSKVTQVSVSGKQFKQLPALVLQCKNLQALELVHTKIKKLPAEMKKLNQLKSIYVLNNNAGKRFKLTSNSSVTELGFRSDKPDYLPKTFKKFKSLEKLDLAQNALVTFPNQVSKNKKLKRLILTGNAIDLSNKIKPIPNLESLDLVRNKIKIVPPAIGGFTNLKKLLFNFNTIESVATEIGNLKKLEELSFYNNQLTNIPEGVYQLTSLRAVDLYFNQIERLDDKLDNWKSLQILYLANNKLISLPENLNKLTSLTELYLHNNRLSILPDAICQLPNLHVLRVNNNYLGEIPSSLSRLTLLENLDISRNQLMLAPNQLTDLTNLKILAMVGNPWSKETKEALPALAAKLRAKEVVVHLNSYEESVDK